MKIISYIIAMADVIIMYKYMRALVCVCDRRIVYCSTSKRPTTISNYHQKPCSVSSIKAFLFSLQNAMTDTNKFRNCKINTIIAPLKI